MPALSQGLRLLLECERSADDALNGIVNSPALHSEVKAALPAIMERTRGCGDAGVRDVVGRRLSTFPQPDRSEGEWVSWWMDYYDALGDLPYEALEGGMKAWLRQPEAFMPKPGELRALALKAGEPIWTAASRAKRAAAAPERRVWVPEEVATRKALAAEVLAGLNLNKATDA